MVHMIWSAIYRSEINDESLTRMHFSGWLLWSDRKSIFMWASAIILESQEEKWTSRISQYICDPILCCIGSCFYHQVSFWSSQFLQFLFFNSAVYWFSWCCVRLIVTPFRIVGSRLMDTKLIFKNKVSFHLYGGIIINLIETILSDLSNDIKQTGSKTGKSLAHLLDESIE